MNRFFSICLLFTGLILSGLHCTAAAQSSDWVYSPYAQYLTNDTTISPPVGEPADAVMQETTTGITTSKAVENRTKEIKSSIVDNL